MILSIDKILVIVFGAASAVFVYWYFLMRKEEQVEAKGEIEILVDGGYKPETIVVPVGQTTKINFVRRDPSSCLEEVILWDFKIRKFLPVGKTESIEVKPEKAGEYRFSCGMNMFHGKLIAK